MSSDFLFIFFSLLLGAFLSWFSVLLLLPILRRRMLDNPNSRSSHSVPTPRGGGLSFVFVSVFASVFYFLIALLSNTSSFSLSTISLPAAPLLSLPLSLIGLIDDRYNISASWRYCVQVITAFFIFSISPLSISLTVVSAVIVLIAITGLINFTNFMDGMDGLVAGCMSVALFAAVIQLRGPWPMIVLVGGLIGFLYWNWSPAKIFMGDVGSTFLGAVFSVLILNSSSWFEALGMLLVLTPLFADAFFCVIRRFFARQSVFKPHRLHLYQRLHQAGWPHSRVSTLYIFATIILSIGFLLGGLALVGLLALVVLLIGVWLDKSSAVPFALASKS